MPNLYELALAGLLHDIGKLGQRAFRGDEGLSEQSRRLEDQACVPAPGYYSHRHVLYTAEFIDRYARGAAVDMVKWANVFRLAVYHHRPESEEGQIVQQADHISSAERVEEDAETERLPDQFRRRGLRPIVNEVSLIARASAVETPPDWAVPTMPVDVSEPFPEREDGRDRTEEYRRLWDELGEAWRGNRVREPWGYIARATSILEHYTSSVPAATNVHPDISLFDHLKTTAAICTCLAAAQDDSLPFILATGDVGGIQRYLYDIRFGAGGMARKLRARSLYVWLVMETAVHHILRQLHLCLPNVILQAGGRFTLLLPNAPGAIAVLEQSEKQMAAWMAQEIGCRLYPHFAWIPAGPEDLERNFATTLSRLMKQLKQAKAQPLRARLIGDSGWSEKAFAMSPVVQSDEQLCDSCQRTGGVVRRIGDEEQVLCDRCYSDMQTGRQLVANRYIALYDQPAKTDDAKINKLPFGYWYRLVGNEKAATDIKPSPYVLIDLDGGTGALAEAPVVGRYIARHVPAEPTENGHIRLLEFETIAANSTGHKLLAYLKADVDNLGLIFSQGLGSHVSISRMATLSRSLELFFGGYVAHLARSYNFIYTVYSGGDDLLVIGPWDQILDFAIRLRDDLTRFTCGNPSWGMSAAILLVHPKTPVLLAAEQADRWLEQAKSGRGNAVVPLSTEETPGTDADVAKDALAVTSRQWWQERLTDAPVKDRLCALGVVTPWRQAKKALAQARKLLEWIESDALSRSQVRRLLMYAEMFQNWQLTGNGFMYRCFPYLAYDIRRNWTEAPEQARQWAQEMLLMGNEWMPLLRFVCEYALRASRSSEEESDAQ